MKRYVPKVLLLCVLGCVLASGTALAANVQCKASGSEDFSLCSGTKNGDRIEGTSGSNLILAGGGADYADGRGSFDGVVGGTGADIIDGGKGDDSLVAAEIKELGFERFDFKDDSNDILRGGSGDDSLMGGFGQGGTDLVYGGEGRDFIGVSQRVNAEEGFMTSVTKEVVKCGPGRDLVVFDLGVDLIDEKTCEFRFPVNANGEQNNESNREVERSKSDVLDLVREVAE